MAITMELFKKDAIEKGIAPVMRLGQEAYLETTHVGLVLDLVEHNYYDDSDFDAIVYNPEKDKVEAVNYATTRFYSYNNGAGIDATPEVIEKAKEAVRRQRLEEKIRVDRLNSKTPMVGKKCVIRHGRKIPIGTEVIVMWIGETQFGKTSRVTTQDGGIFYCNLGNMEVMDPDQYLTDPEELKTLLLDNEPAHFNWRT